MSPERFVKEGSERTSCFHWVIHYALLPPKFVAQITILEARNRVQLFLLGLAGSQHLPPVLGGAA